jgi:DNA-binding LacI/PurR family transcriptional regulator
MSSTNADVSSGSGEIGEEPFKLPKPGDYHKTITMATIAKAAGVSQGAISSMLNDRDYGIRVSEKTRERVFKVCRELNYIPNDLRAIVRMYPETGDVCLLASSDIGDIARHPHYSRLISSSLAVLPATSKQVILSIYDPGIDYNAQPELLPQPIQSGVASKFLVFGTPNLSLCQSIVSRGFPVSVVGREVTLPGVTSILPDYAQASQIAIEYLFNLGHTRIAIFSGPFGSTDYSIIELNRGLRTGYDKIGVPIEAQNIIYGDLTFHNGFNAAETLLARQPKPTAFFCLSDISAAGVMARAHVRGLKVPKDLSILGCSDDTVVDYVEPALSTVHLPVEEMAVEGLNEVLRRIKDQETGLAESNKILVPVRLVERESCAKPKA